MEVYNLTEEEKKILREIDVPRCSGKTVLTKPVIVAYSLYTGKVIGLQSLRQWRLVLKGVPEFANLFRFELRNMW